MPYYGSSIRHCRVRSKLGRELDEQYKRHEIGWAHYNKIKDKPKYWEIRTNYGQIWMLIRCK